ncbi:hypothetical protein CBS147346_5539 [Aspergillus niger]|nr:hypothetical protein CBS147346_5539 [Aspergillus niger]
MLEGRSLTEPIRRILSKEHGSVKFCKASVSKIDYANRVVHINSNDKVSFDLLVVGIGAENATFGIPGVKEHACFLKELEDAREIRQRVINCIEQASQEQNDTELERKLHMVVVGGGPTGIETAAEMRDFFRNDVQRLFPKLSDKVKVTLVEALPSVLQMFPKGLIEYTESKFLAEHIDILKNTKVKRATETHIEAEVTQPDGSIKTELVPYGVLVWAAGNAVRPVVRDLMDQPPEQASSRRGLLVDEYLRVKVQLGKSHIKKALTLHNFSIKPMQMPGKTWQERNFHHPLNILTKDLLPTLAMVVRSQIYQFSARICPLLEH